MKRRSNELSDDERKQTLDTLYAAAAAVHGRDSMKLFLRDLLTESERIMLGRRILIARHLLAGKRWDDIAADMKVGLDTVGKVQHWLDDQLPGYEQALAGLQKELARRQFNRRYAKSALFRLKKKYPAHFLLFPLPKEKEKDKNK